MASPLDVHRFMARNAMTLYPIDGDYTTAADIDKWVDMRGFDGILMAACGINLTGVGPEAITVIGNVESDGSGTDYVIHTYGGSAATTEGDYIFEEVSAVQIAQVGTDNGVELRYVSVKLEMGNAADEAVVVYTRFGGPEYLDQTAENVT